MTKMDKPSAFSRRAVLKGAGALVVSIGAPLGLDALLAINAAYAQGTKPPLMPDQLSSYIAINADGTVAAFFGKMDMGHGLFVAIGQMVAEELDVPFNRVKVVMGDTASTINQGGASRQSGIWFGGNTNGCSHAMVTSTATLQSQVAGFTGNATQLLCREIHIEAYTIAGPPPIPMLRAWVRVIHGGPNWQTNMVMLQEDIAQ